MADEAKFFYANSVEIAMSGYDVTLRLVRNGARSASGGKAGFATSEAVMAEEDAMSVCMSPSHAKALLPGLMDVVLRYEELFGKIPLPPEAATAWERRFGEATK